jgi:predicted ATPase
MGTTHKIDHLTIEGFQSIRRLDKLPLGYLNVLIGANGAGKSNFVSYFRMLGELVEQRLQVWTRSRGSSDRLLTYGVKETKQIKSFVEFGRNGYEFTLEPTVDGSFVFAGERMFFDGPYYGKEWINLGFGHSEAKLKSKASGGSGVEDYCYDSISSWKVYHFHDTSDSAGVKRLRSIQDNKFLRSNAENLAAYLFMMQKRRPNVYNQIRKVVKLAIPFFDDFVLEQDAFDPSQIQLLWRQENSDYSLLPSQLSDGSIRFICLATALLQPDPPSTIIIDEPELGLHPYAITLLGSLMRSASQNMQIIVSTQSVPLLDEFSIGDLVVVEREEGVSVFKRLKEGEFRDWLEDYTVGELWEKNILGGRP